ncbi:nitroreductase family protein [Proteocatella sphenisci]|uniref:nitroreductase family protein n=1 Tax=Proteocatella sphenisci TaxID=181070 RepID=UPI000491CF72|nr:nitroreductase family protein [Proteocatella sphenisci]
MNSILKALFERKSVRAYEEREIPEEIKSLIIEAALQAPTAGNQMLYSILDITDQKLKDELAISCDNQPFIAKAPMVLIFLADCRRWLDSYEFAGMSPRKPGKGDLLLACQDAVVAAQNAVVAAESLGIGSCYIGDILENAEKHIKLLNLDEYVMPASMVVFGYPIYQQKERKKPVRFEKRFIVHENSYKRLSKEEHVEMFTQRSQESDFDFEDYVSKFCKRKYMSDFSKEMSRSAEIYLRNFEAQDE